MPVNNNLQTATSIKTAARLPNVAVAPPTAGPIPPIATQTRPQLLQTLRGLRLALGWRLRGRQRAVPRTNTQLRNRIVRLRHWLRVRGPRPIQ